jgi:hypothetical protein
MAVTNHREAQAYSLAAERARLRRPGHWLKDILVNPDQPPALT